MNTEEYLDLVDENDQVIGRKLRSEVHAEGLHNFRAVNVFIVNEKGEIWIPRRQAHKQIAPLGFDMSMGGHVESGETYEEALKREAMEELNIDTDLIPVRLLGHLTPSKDGVHCFQNVYEIRSDVVPEFNPDDFIEYFWLNPQVLLDRITSGEKAKSDLSILVKKFYAK